MIRNSQELEPEETELGQDPPLIRNHCREDPIERADSVGSNHQEAVAEVVNVPDFALSRQLSCHAAIPCIPEVQNLSESPAWEGHVSGTHCSPRPLPLGPLFFKVHRHSSRSFRCESHIPAQCDGSLRLSPLGRAG
jgi:hypothetical protein